MREYSERRKKSREAKKRELAGRAKGMQIRGRWVASSKYVFTSAHTSLMF